MKGLTMPFSLQGMDVFVNSNLGISMYPQNGLTYNELTRNAELALVQAKKNAVNTYQFFTKELFQKVTDASILGSELRWAIQKSSLCFTTNL